MEMRKDFPLLENNEISYLDSGATSQKPKKVIEAIQNFYEKYNANPHRGAYQLSVEATALYEEARQKITKVTLEPKTFLDLGEWDLYLDELDEKTNLAKQIHLIRKRDSDALSTKVNASSGKIILTDKAIGLQLQDGQMQRIDKKDPTAIIAANFDKYTMSISLLKGNKRHIRVGELTTTKMWRQLRHNRFTPEQKAEYRTEISTRNVMAFSPIILLLVSCPLGFSLGKRSNKGWGMLFSVIIIFTFYLLMTLGLSIGKKYTILAYPAPWLPIFVGIGAGIYLWKKRLNI